jgi:hypothetical protein
MASKKQLTAGTKLEMVQLELLKENERNARKHGDKQVDQIVESIKEFGFTNPLLVDEANVLIAGHGRLLAAKKLGLVEVPVIRLAGLTEAQKLAYLVADNKIQLNSSWDEPLLQGVLLDLAGLDFDVTKTGFDDSEITKLLKADASPLGDDLLAGDQDGFEEDEDEAAFPTEEAVGGGNPGEDPSLVPLASKGYEAGKIAYYLVFGKVHVPMSTEEYNALRKAYEDFVTKFGVQHGFVTRLINSFQLDVTHAKSDTVNA